jgi:hypothetical protein
MIEKMLHYLYDEGYEDGSSPTGITWGNWKPLEPEPEDEHIKDEITRSESPEMSETSAVRADSDMVDKETPAHVNVWMYIIADKYFIRGLKELAREKFELSFKIAWEDTKFTSVIGIIYGQRGPKDSDIRGVVTKLAIQHLSSLKDRQEFHAVLKNYPDFAYDFSIVMMDKVLQLEKEVW